MVRKKRTRIQQILWETRDPWYIRLQLWLKWNVCLAIGHKEPLGAKMGLPEGSGICSRCDRAVDRNY
jgi:hypothetical protein